jgi:hypothetical protein
VLEELNQRVQAFDVLGNPVPCFSVGQQSFQIDASLLAALNSRDATTALVQAFQRNVQPAVAPIFLEDEDDAPASIAALDGGTVDKALSDAFIKAGLVKAGAQGESPSFKVDVTTAGSLWLVTDTATSAVYDVRALTDDFGTQQLYVFRAFVLGIEIKSAGSEWIITDTANAMTFDVVDKDPTSDKRSPDLRVTRLLATMPLRTQNETGITHIDIAAEATGYIYTLLTKDQQDGSKEYYLEVYAPDGTPLFAQPGVYVAKIAVDQWRSLFSLNYETLLGPGQRTEPGVSQWQPSTPAGVGPS